MRFDWLRIDNLMGCDYEIEFDPKYTIIIGNNRQGKTLVARLMVLSLYGLKQPKELGDSWRLRAEELLPTGNRGMVELILSKGENQRYRLIRQFQNSNAEVRFFKESQGEWRLLSRRDSEIKILLEEEIGITPGLLSVVMSNEQNLIGAISYDEALQANVWEGWKWRAEIIKENIRKARDKCSREANSLREEIGDSSDVLNSIVRGWVEKSIFSENEIKRGIDSSRLHKKLSLIEDKIKNLERKIEYYTSFFEELVRRDDLENEGVVRRLIEVFEVRKEFLDEKREIENLKEECKKYWQLLSLVLSYGGKEGLWNRIRNLEDEEKKLRAAKGIIKRRKEPLRIECKIYPPEEGVNLLVQIPEEAAQNFKYEEITTGEIAIPYNKEKEEKIIVKREEFENLIKNFEEKRNQVKRIKEEMRSKIGEKRNKLSAENTKLREQRTILEVDKERYLEISRRIKENQRVLRKLEIARKWFGKLYNVLNEEESLKRIRKETVAFINRIYERTYGWNIYAKLEEGDRVVIADSYGNIRSHPSGSEIHIMGLAWRWMVARGFDLPLILDELDSLLDEKNFEKTRKLIEEEMDRQVIILTLKEGLADLPGKVYKVVREGDLSTLISS